MEYEAFLAGIETQDAVVRNIEIMGEAAKRLSEQVPEQYLQRPLKQMTEVRDRLIHDYFGVNLNTVWQIVDAELLKVLLVLGSIEPNGLGD